MKVIMTKDIIMNANTNQDNSNLNVSSNVSHHGSSGGGDAVADGETKPQQQPGGSSPSDQPQPSESTSGGNITNMEYLKSLANVMTAQDASRNSSSALSTSLQFDSNYNNPGAAAAAAAGGSNNNSNNNNNFSHMQNNAYSSDTDTCASSNVAARRISRDSLVSRDSLSDMLSADQVASNNLAMMNMLASHQQQQGMGGNHFNNANGSALNQSMSQLMMNGTTNQMGGHLNGTTASSMMNNSSMGGVATGWNAAAAGNSASSMGMNDATLRNAYPFEASGSSLTGASPLLIPPKKTKNRQKHTFAQKLMHVLGLRECQDAIRWMPNGCAFCIVDSKALIENVLPRYFKEAKYTSFTRKLNRWGFKHFTLPTSEPSRDKEMSIYTHEKFLRDNPALCQQMDGGHRRRNSQKESGQDGMAGGQGAAFSAAARASGQGDLQQQMQQNMMIQQMQQLQQQNMMMQQMQMQNQMSGGQNQAGENQLFDINMSALDAGRGGAAAAGGSSNFNSMMGSAYNNNSNSLMGNHQMGNHGSINNNPGPIGMRRTSLGYMPYLPTSARRGSGFSTGGLSAVSNDLGGSFTGGAPSSDLAGSLLLTGNSTQSLEKFHKMSPGLMAGGGSGVMNNETFDDFKGNNHNQGSGGGSSDALEEDYRHSQAKLAVLEDMIAKERKKQSLL